MAWLAELEPGTEWVDVGIRFTLFKRVHDGCAAKELPAAQLVRVLRKALLAHIAEHETPAADEEA